MKRLLFFGKRKFLTIPMVVGIGLVLWPFFIGGGLVYFLYKKVPHQTTRLALVGVVSLFTLLVGSGWLIALNSNTPPTAKEEVSGVTATITPTPSQEVSPTPEEPKEAVFKVIKVVDGDTISIEGGQTIRYIGIDTPETVDPRTSVQCFGKAASDKNKELVGGKEIKLEKDISETDKYGRLLRYIYVGDTFVNEYLVRQGYAKASSYPPDVKYQELFKEAEKEARDNNRGLWKECGETKGASITTTPKPTAKPTNKPTAKPTSQSTSGNSSNFQDSSIDKDCKDFTTHAQAQAYFNSKGGSPSNNVDGLDADHDGLACETLP